MLRGKLNSVFTELCTNFITSCGSIIISRQKAKKDRYGPVYAQATIEIFQKDAKEIMSSIHLYG